MFAKFKTNSLLRSLKTKTKLIGENCILSNDIQIFNMKEILSIKSNCYIGHNCSFYSIDSHKKVPNFIIEKKANINNRCKFVIGDEDIRIGENTLIGPGTCFYGFNHSMARDGSFNGPLISKEIIIGNNCWLGCNVVVVAGVHIGDGCVVGAGSIVTKDFPDGVMIAGNPARIIKKYDKTLNDWVKL